MMALLLNLLALAVTFVGGLLIMIYGWGLTPVSWGWVVGGWFFSIIVAGFLQYASKNI